MKLNETECKIFPATVSDVQRFKEREDKFWNVIKTSKPFLIFINSFSKSKLLQSYSNPALPYNQ